MGSAGIFVLGKLFLLGALGMGPLCPPSLSGKLIFGLAYVTVIVDTSIFAISCFRLICLSFGASWARRKSKWDYWLLVFPPLQLCIIVLLIVAVGSKS